MEAPCSKSYPFHRTTTSSFPKASTSQVLSFLLGMVATSVVSKSREHKKPALLEFSSTATLAMMVLLRWRMATSLTPTDLLAARPLSNGEVFSSSACILATRRHQDILRTRIPLVPKGSISLLFPACPSRLQMRPNYCNYPLATAPLDSSITVCLRCSKHVIGSLILDSRHQGHADLEHYGCYSRAYPRRNCCYW